MKTFACHICLILTIALFFFLTPFSSDALEGQVNINTATVEELKELPFIGKERAQAIVQYRKQYGPFVSLDDLKNIPAIGLSTFDAISPYLTITKQQQSVRQSPLPKGQDSFKVTPRIHTSPGEIIMLPNSDYFDTLVSYIRDAQHSINMTMFIFKTTQSPQNRPALILQELIKARKRGINIQITLDKSGYDEGINKENMKVTKKLQRNGIDVRMDSEKRTTHAKIVVIDDQFVFVGSHNLTHSALALNNEFSLLVNSRTLAEELLQYMREIK